MMNNKKNVPDIRFKGFNFGWKSKRFDKTFSMLSNNTLSRADLNYEKGSTKNVHYGDILIRFGECTNVARENIPYISDDKVADKYISSRLQDGDIVFADTAEDATAGKCSEFFNIQEQPIISGLHTIPCHPLLPFSIGYLGYFLNSPSYHNQLLPLMQGTKVVGISKTAIKETNISFPEDVDEQQAIGNYFQNIDRLINTSQTKLDKLKNIKKACLEKMFPRNGSTTPELRFKGFSEEWEEKEMSIVAIFNPKSELPEVFEYVDLESVVGTEMISHREESKLTAPSRAQRLAKQGDLFYQTVRPYQRNNHLFDKDIDNYVFSTGYAQLRPYGNGYFLLSLVQGELFVKTVLDNCTGTSYPAISSTDLAKIKVSIPKYDEQKTIGSLFKNLDILIAKTEQQINKLKNIKKACLDKMFVNAEG